MRCRLAVIGLLLILCCSAGVASVGTPAMRNISGPAFLHGIGPHEPRTDNPAAAGFTAIVVAAVILRGLHVDQDDRSAAINRDD